MFNLILNEKSKKFVEVLATANILITSGQLLATPQDHSIDTLSAVYELSAEVGTPNVNGGCNNGGCGNGGCGNGAC